MKRLYVICMFFSFLLCSHAQQFQIEGSVVDSITGKGLPGANVLVHRQTEGTFYGGVISDSLGRFRISCSERNLFSISFSYLGYHPRSINIDLDSYVNLDRITLVKDTIFIDDVEIIWKPIIEYDNEGNVSLNIDELGNVDLLSVSEVIQTIPGLEIDFEGNIYYNGYENFTKLIDGEKFGSMIIDIANGNERLKLIQIPAKLIKRVDIYPEPNGRFGYYSPVINLIPRGNLRDTYSATVDLANMQKYLFSFQGIKKIKKITFKPRLAYKDQSNIENQFNNRTSMVSEAYNIYKHDSTRQRLFLPALGLKYSIGKMHWLSTNVSYTSKDESYYLAQVIDYENDAPNSYTTDNRIINGNDYALNISYFNRIYLGYRQYLNLRFNSSISNQKDQQLQDYNINEDLHNYNFDKTTQSKLIKLNADYSNLKHKYAFFINTSCNLSESHIFSNREEYNSHNNQWVKLGQYSGNTVYRRNTFNTKFSVSKSKKNTESIRNYFRLNMEGSLRQESQNDLLLNSSDNDLNLFFQNNLLYRRTNKSNRVLQFDIRNSYRYPSFKQLSNTTLYINSLNQSTGNPDLKPEAVYYFSTNISKNDNSGVITLKVGNTPNQSKNDDKSALNNFGYRLGFAYTEARNAIVNTQTLSMDSILIHTWDNAEKKQTARLNYKFTGSLTKTVKIRVLGEASLVNYINDGIPALSYNYNTYLGAQFAFPSHIKIVIGGAYHSPNTMYNSQIEEYFDANISISKLMLKKKLEISFEADNIFAFKGREIEYFGSNYVESRTIYPEFPQIWIKATVLLFSYYEKME